MLWVLGTIHKLEEVRARIRLIDNCGNLFKRVYYCRLINVCAWSEEQMRKYRGLLTASKAPPRPLPFHIIISLYVHSARAHSSKCSIMCPPA